MAAPIARHHAEWLSLIEVSGPFLSVPVLERAFPQGLDADDPKLARALRTALDEQAADTGLRWAWVRWVLTDLLGHPDDLVRDASAIPAGLEHRVAEHDETLRPDLVIVEPGDGAPRARVLVTVWPAGQPLDARAADRRWAVSPRERAAELCRATGVRLALVTNGEQWTLVDAQPNETAGFATWDAELWLDERLTLRAFRSLVSPLRLFGVSAPDRLEALLDESAGAQQEVTDQLGLQVRRAIELLIAAIDAADRERDNELLANVSNRELYLAAVTVMMRLVFLLSAEERGLLPLEDPLYAEAYAASTLRERLRAEADRHGEDPLERRTSAWHRLLALARAVHGGVQHEELHLPAYGGQLFDPDRFPFLEGRAPETKWRDEGAEPLPVDDRTVLHILDALQLLALRGRRGATGEAQRLSYRALDVEQIGHVYEGLLDHTAVRVNDTALGLDGRLEPELALRELEARRASDGDAGLAAWLAKQTGRGAATLGRLLDVAPDAHRRARLLAACGNDAALADRVLPFQALLRDDLRGNPTIFQEGSVYVTQALDRRTSGTYYTPRSLAEEVVRHALDAVAYAPGPADTAEPAAWRLKPPAELLALRVCDMAMGSGAFLVAACRYLAARLFEAWDALGDGAWTAEGEAATGEPGELVLPLDAAEREVLARRLIADRCLYGVDKNPMAVDMAKLSLWLVTMARDRPFSFLDHALREGDALLGLTSLAQVEHLHMDPRRGEALHGTLFGFTEFCSPAVARALFLRRELEAFPVLDVRDATQKAELLRDAEEALAAVRVLGDVVAAAALRACGDGDDLDTALTSISPLVRAALDTSSSRREVALSDLRARAAEWLAAGRAELRGARRPFHWPLEFPEVSAAGGFDAIVGNPPFQGGQKITGTLGTDYRDLLVTWLAGGRRGSADLVAYFFLRAAMITAPGASVALLATNTIGQGDTREVGLEQLTASGWTISRAVPSRPWPGGANLEVAHLWLHRGGWSGSRWLDDVEVRGITPSLEPQSRVSGPAHRLVANGGKSFQGSNVLGMGFVLTPDQAEALIARDERNRDVVMPYLNGEDLNSRPDQSASRWVINFRDWPIERAQGYPAPFEIAERLVKPERARNNRAARRERWWRFAEPAPNLYTAIADLDCVLVLTLVSKAVQVVRVRNSGVFAHKLGVFAYDDDAHFGLLTSGVHWWWAVTRGSTLETRTNYSPSDCFETFPQPDLTAAVTEAGGRLDTHRRELMLERQEGLTKTYNRVHDPDERAEDINELRRLHVELDHAVAAAYGWSDLALDHGFHDTRQGVRFTFSSAQRTEVLDLLLELNHERYAAEVRRGLHDKTAGRRKRAAAAQSALFGA